MLDEVETVRRIFSAPAADPEARKRALAQLREAMALEGAKPAVPPRSPRRAIALAGVAAAIVATFIVSQSIFTRESAASELRRLESIARTSRANVIPNGSYYHTARQGSVLDRTALATGGSLVYFVDQSVETWTDADGSLTRVTVTSEPRFLSEGDREAFEALGIKDQAGREVRVFTDDALIKMDLSDLPTDPVTLEQVIRSGRTMIRGATDSDVLSVIGELLTSTPASPELRAALFEVAARLPNVEFVGDVEDPLGRPGVGVQLSDGSHEHELIFDASTSELMANLTLPLGGGTPVDSTTYTSQGIVTSPPPTN